MTSARRDERGLCTLEWILIVAADAVPPSPIGSSSSEA